MYRSVKKGALTSKIVFMRFEAPRIDSSNHACQFVIIRANEDGKRIPVMVTGTSKLASLSESESVTDIAGPLESLRMLRNLPKRKATMS